MALPIYKKFVQVLKDMRNDESPGENNITIEMIRYGRQAILQEMYQIVKNI